MMSAPKWAGPWEDLVMKVTRLDQENANLKKEIEELRAILMGLIGANVTGAKVRD